ncbi:sensor histidine kinase [Mucilaginibacter terrenus]|uniref:Sensor histidine kinase n=1 Tax=Mucilaginibacter terrenus TaxID=2482727 RepID=A0A3E2NYB0_9SPHI|nr:histidine kinase [Mucilaginibacter terrenus]RFZ85977.1 sensor histidine kinase [Mucilaginibacter terrenus]
MLQRSKRNVINVFIQILIWVVLGNILLFYQPFLRDISVPYQFWIKQIFVFLLLITAYYINAHVLVPQFLLKKRTGIYFLLIIAIIVAVVFLAGFLDRALQIRHLLEEAFHRNGPPRGGRGGGRGYFDTFTITLTSLVLGISTSVRTTQDWKKNDERQKEMEAEKISSELSFLKAQINPHFFFNTLNNIYALTLVNVETSRTAIHQLSRMMRYVLYDTQNSTALLSQEVAFVKDYISLMQLRLTDKVTVNYQAPVQVSEQPIAPMLFLPFVENAFKHGVSDTLPSTITVHISQEASQVILVVKNSIFKKRGADLEENKGIGLNNTIRRLELLYPGKYTLDVNEDKDANTYTVTLTLLLA